MFQLSGSSLPTWIELDNKGLKFRRKLGEGAFGVVYKVTSKNTATDFALKDVLCEDNSYDANEVKALQKLRHQNVLTFITDFVATDPGGQLHPLILTEYCAGGNLNKRLTRPSSDFVNFKWMKQCVSALTFLHEHGVVHRDLKPENVLLTESEDVKLADFGLTRKYNTFKTDTLQDNTCTKYMKTWAGTIHWMAPEVFKGHYTEKADIFSLGVMFFAILDRDFLAIDGEKFYGVFSYQIGEGKFGIGYAMASYDTERQVAFSDHAQGSKQMQRIALDPLKYDPLQRPSAAKIHEEFETMAEEMQFWAAAAKNEASKVLCPIS